MHETDSQNSLNKVKIAKIKPEIQNKSRSKKKKKKRNFFKKKKYCCAILIVALLFIVATFYTIIKIIKQNEVDVDRNKASYNESCDSSIKCKDSLQCVNSKCTCDYPLKWNNITCDKFINLTAVVSLLILVYLLILMTLCLI
jgi:hypothetical protein